MNIYITITQETTKMFPMHKHNAVEFMCYEKGTGHLKTQNGDYGFKEGTVIVIPPGVVHGSTSDNNFVNICVHADVDIPDSAIHYFYDGTGQQRKLFQLLRDLYFSGNANENAVFFLTMALKEMIYHPIIAANENGDINIQVRRVYEQIVKDFQKPNFDLVGLLSTTGYNEDYFRKCFTEQYSLSPKKYLDKLRLDYAAGLINTYGDKLEIGQVASMCGYDDLLYFSKKFKTRFGCSPTKYRAENSLNSTKK